MGKWFLIVLHIVCIAVSSVIIAGNINDGSAVMSAINAAIITSLIYGLVSVIKEGRA